MNVHYLEIVTTEVESTCHALTALHGATFEDPNPSLGNARVASLGTGGRIGVRAPMHADELPTVRPYLLVEDIHAAIQEAESCGAEVLHPPLEIPGQGAFAIFAIGEVHHGLWQN